MATRGADGVLKARRARRSIAVVCCLLQRTRGEAVFCGSQRYWVVSVEP